MRDRGEIFLHLMGAGSVALESRFMGTDPLIKNDFKAKVESHIEISFGAVVTVRRAERARLPPTPSVIVHGTVHCARGW